MTIKNTPGETLCFHDGYKTLLELRGDLTKRLSTIAELKNIKKGMLVKYNNPTHTQTAKITI